MTKPNDLVKAAAAGVKGAGVKAQADPKKVKSLVEAFPYLSEEVAAILLQEYNGSLKHASEAALDGERWKQIKVKKPKRDEKPAEVATPVDARPPRKERDNKDFVKKEDRPLRDKKDFKSASKASAAAVAAVPEVKSASVHQTGVSTTSWAKGGVSFADMLKKQSGPAETVAPAPSPAAPSPKVEEAKKPKKEQTEAVPAASAAPAPAVAAAAPAVVAPAAAPAAVAAAAPAAADAEKKPRRERKPREATAATEEAPKAAVTSAPAPAAPVPAPAPAVATVAAPTAAPAPRITKYILEVDRLGEPLTLPNHVVELAQRFSSTYSFDGTPGRRAPTPPAPAALAQPQPNSNFTMLQPRHSWNSAGAEQHGNIPPQQQQQQQQQQRQMNQQPQMNWENHSVNAWGRPTAGPANFTSYQTPYGYRANPNVGNYGRYPHHNNIHSHHHPRHPEQVASDAAYSAIRDDPAQGRFNAGVW